MHSKRLQVIEVVEGLSDYYILLTKLRLKIKAKGKERYGHTKVR